VRSHIRRFWDPRMRREIIAHATEGGAGLTPTAKSAIALLTNSPNQSK
jgi:formate dehydrogenase subunit delta